MLNLNEHSIELDFKLLMYELIQRLRELAVEFALKSLKVVIKKQENAEIYLCKNRGVYSKKG